MDFFFLLEAKRRKSRERRGEETETSGGAEEEEQLKRKRDTSAGPAADRIGENRTGEDVVTAAHQTVGGNAEKEKESIGGTRDGKESI